MQNPDELRPYRLFNLSLLQTMLILAILGGTLAYWFS